MKEIIGIVVIIVAIFIADKSVPSYEDHIEALNNKLYSSIKSGNAIEQGLTALVGTGVIATNTRCKTLSLAQFELASVCTLEFRGAKAKSFGIFGKVFIF